MKITKTLVVAIESIVGLGSLVADRARARALGLRGARVGRKARVGPGCTFRNPWCIALGERTQLEANVFIKVTSVSAQLSVGDFSFIGRGTEIDVSKEVIIGAHALIAPGCFVTDHSHGHEKRDVRIDQRQRAAASVRVGHDTWLGAGTVVLPGVTIGDGAVVGANAVVRQDVPAYEIYGGVPARKIGERR